MTIDDILQVHPVSAPLTEEDTRAKLIDRIMRRRGWTEDQSKREETLGTVDMINGTGRRRAQRRADYVLRVKVTPNTQPVAMAFSFGVVGACPCRKFFSDATAARRIQRIVLTYSTR